MKKDKDIPDNISNSEKSLLLKNQLNQLNKVSEPFNMQKQNKFIQVDHDGIYSIPQVAKLFGVSRQYITTLVKLKKINATKIGRFFIIFGHECIKYNNLSNIRRDNILLSKIKKRAV